MKKTQARHAVLTAALEHHNLKPRQAAKRLGVSPTTFGKWLRTESPGNLSVEIEVRLLEFTNKKSLAEIWPPNAYPDVTGETLPEDDEETAERRSGGERRTIKDHSLKRLAGPTRERRGSAEQENLERFVREPEDPYQKLCRLQEENARRTMFENALEHIPEQERSIIRIAFYDDVTDNEQLGKIFNISSEEADRRIIDGMHSLKEYFLSSKKKAN